MLHFLFGFIVGFTSATMVGLIAALLIKLIRRYS
jgi:hypothetical protein